MNGVIPRRYWKICEVAEELKIKASEIRFWEAEFGIQVPRTKAGDRRYSVQDKDLIRCIYNLLNVDGYTIRGAKKRLASILLNPAKPRHFVNLVIHHRMPIK